MAPASTSRDRTAAASFLSQMISTPKQSLVNRGSTSGVRVSRGSRANRRKPSMPPIAPSRIVSSNAITTNGGIETSSLPPVISGHADTV